MVVWCGSMTSVSFVVSPVVPVVVVPVPSGVGSGGSGSVILVPVPGPAGPPGAAGTTWSSLAGIP